MLRMTISMPRLDRLPAEERGLTIGDFLVPIRVSERMYTRARHVALVLIGVLLITVGAQIAFTVPGNALPYTFQSFGVLLSAGALGFRRGIAASGTYLLLGAFGLPVFPGAGHGLEVIQGPTGGYLAGSVLASAIVGRLAELGWDRSVVGSVAAMVFGSLAIYAVGVPWLSAATTQDLGQAADAGLRPYLAWDALKIVLGAAAFPIAWWFVGRRPGDR
jgi:biotin transport system substrate-specific component